MTKRQGEKPKKTTSIKIDPDLLKYAQDWASYNLTTFSAMVEALVRNVIDRDKQWILEQRKGTKTLLEVLALDLSKTPGYKAGSHEVTINGVDVTDKHTVDELKLTPAQKKKLDLAAKKRRDNFKKEAKKIK